MFCFSRKRYHQSISPAPTQADILQAIAKSTPLSEPRRSLTAARVRPENNANANSARPSSTKITRRPDIRDVASGLYHWTTCLFIVGLVFSQLTGAVWDTTTTTQPIVYGRSPLLGPSQIVGTNDVPYTDRVIACVKNGQFYEPRVVSSLFAEPGATILEDSTGTAIHGYRLKQRHISAVTDSLDSIALPVYQSSCALIADTMDNILDACSKLGYSNLTRDNLRVVDDWNSENLFLLPNTLPVLIMPFWDNAAYARHAVPTWGGNACVFRLEDAYSEDGGVSAMANFRGVNQSVREQRTIEWLKRPGGVWKNGWYEDPEGMLWYSDVTSSIKGPPYYMMFRLFDMRSGEESDCSSPSECEGETHFEWWGDKFCAGNRYHKLNSVYIANATEWGLFIYESDEVLVVRSVFDWETLLSNVSGGLVLVSWFLALIALHSGVLRDNTKWVGGGISCISGARSFAYLPIASMPRLKMTLAAFFTVGCEFEGQQQGLAESWFAVYPGIVHLVLIYFSLLNMLAKVLRRRVSDVLFTPTVLILCLLHYFRQALASSSLLDDIDGRVSTVIFSDEVKKLQLADYFTTDVAWRMNGRVTKLFYAKLGILGINLLPVVFCRSFPISDQNSNLNLRGVEKALALRARHVGGLGCSPTYIVADIDRRMRRLLSTMIVARIDASIKDNNIEDIMPRYDPPGHFALMSCYELTRLGYFVFGDKYLIAFDEWALVSSMALFRSLSNSRVVVWTLRTANADGDVELAGGRELDCTEPQLWRLDDPRLRRIRWWQVSACNIRC